MNVQIIAKRYADALFAQIEETEGASKIWDELKELALLSETGSDFSDVVKSPLILPEEKEAVFRALKDSGKISGVLYNFISLLIEKKRLEILPDIYKEIHKLVLNEKNEIEAEAVFASKPGAEAKKELTRRLENITGKKVILMETIDPSVIGGVKVRMGSMLYDATVKGQVEKLKASLV